MLRWSKADIDRFSGLLGTLLAIFEIGGWVFLVNQSEIGDPRGRIATQPKSPRDLDGLLKERSLFEQYVASAG